MHAYRFLLRLLPASFRQEYGGQMCSLFEQRYQAERWGGRLMLWLETIADLITASMAAHADALRQDLRYAARTLARSPGFTFTAIAITAMGIGATTTAFSLADHVLLRPLPFPDSDRLVQLWEDQSPAGYSAVEPSPPNYRDWRALSHSFSSMAAFHGLSASMQAPGGEPQLIEGSVFTAGLMPMLGAHASLGRIFSQTDDRDGAPGTVVLSDRFWHSRFGGDPRVLGVKILLDGEPFEVIGVMPPDFLFPRRDVVLWRAARFAPDDWADRTNNWLHVIARVKPDVTLKQASLEMRQLGARLALAYPKENAHISVTTESLQDSVVPRQSSLWILLGAAGCVLAVASFNLANVLLARALGRRKEIAVRTALGAGRERVVRQMITETSLVVFLGAVAGVALSFTIAPLLRNLVPLSVPVPDIPAINGRVLLFASVVSALTAFAAGVWPALRATSQLDVHGLQEGGRSGSAGARREGIRQTLVVSEVTASIALLIVSGLLMQALAHIRQTDPGFRSAGVLTARTSLPFPKYASTARRIAFYHQVLDQAARLPGVTAAGYTSFLPMVMRGGVWPVRLPGQQITGVSMATMRFITPGFLSALGIPLLAGRNIAEQDTLQSPLVAVVSRNFAVKYWPGQNPLGRQFEIAQSLRTIVGIAGEVRVRGLERSSEPQVYLPYRQQPDNSFVWYAPKDLVILGNTHVRSLIPELRRIIHQLDPEQPVSDIQEMSQIVNEETLPRSLQMRMVGTFAALAFLLAAIGIYGLLSFSVSARTQEIGVRVALGARPAQVLQAVLREGLILAALGTLLGITGGYAAGSTIRAVLAGVQPGEWPIYAAAALLAAVMVGGGSLIPAWRALRIDPAVALRSD